MRGPGARRRAHAIPKRGGALGLPPSGLAAARVDLKQRHLGRIRYGCNGLGRAAVLLPETREVPMLASKQRRLLGPVMAMCLAAMLTLLTGLAWAGPNPPGNNGTVKIDDTPFDDHPNNEPHVGCVFQVDFYGYDEGDLDATVTFEAHPPTLRDGDDQVLLTDTVFIGEDDNSGGGSEAGLDASETYTLDLTGIEPHANQGVHVKLTIHAEGSQGADVKHKVFWVTGCGPGPTTTTTTKPTTSTSRETTTTKASSTSGATSTSEVTSTSGASSTGRETTTTAEVGGSASSGPGGSSSPGGGVLPVTGGVLSLPMLVAAVALLGLGVASVLSSSRRRRHS